MPDVAKLIQIITHMCKMIFNTFLIVSSEKRTTLYFMAVILWFRFHGVVVSTIASQ